MATTGLTLETIAEPDNTALQFGREFGNRGQCNPTYFTVGNLIKHLIYLRDEVGLSREEIVENYAYVTAGGCGPCRMGMYATEYRKALRDSGFRDFRVLIFTRSGDVEDVLMEGLGLDTKTLLVFFMSLMIGDILNTMNLRYRPYEKNYGETDLVIEKAQQMISEALKEQKGILKAVWGARRLIQSIELEKEQKKPLVHIMGEFWAKTTDGDGNYSLFRFIEKEGGVVSNETITDWLVHQVWRAKWLDKRKQKNFWNIKNQIVFTFVNWLIQLTFKFYCVLLGTKIELSDHKALAKDAEEYFDIHVDGGEDHMEVAHHIHMAKHELVDMIISVKPFSCLSSSGVSDGVQVKVCEDYPNLEFVAVETNGDSAANFYSRIQMGLQKVLRQYR